MVLPANMAKAVYNDPGIEQYRGNPDRGVATCHDHAADKAGVKRFYQV